MKTFIIAFVICLIATSSFAWSDLDKMSDREYQLYMEKCPLGDATMVMKKDQGIEFYAYCLTLSKDGKSWLAITSEDDLAKIVILDTDKWDAFTMDYHLTATKGKLYREKTYDRPEDLATVEKYINKKK